MDEDSGSSDLQGPRGRKSRWPWEQLDNTGTHQKMRCLARLLEKCGSTLFAHIQPQRDSARRPCCHLPLHGSSPGDPGFAAIPALNTGQPNLKIQNMLT